MKNSFVWCCPTEEKGLHRKLLPYSPYTVFSLVHPKIHKCCSILQPITEKKRACTLLRKERKSNMYFVIIQLSDLVWHIQMARSFGNYTWPKLVHCFNDEVRSGPVPSDQSAGSKQRGWLLPGMLMKLSEGEWESWTVALDWQGWISG